MKSPHSTALSSDARSVLAIIGGAIVALIFMTAWVAYSQWQRYENELESIGPRVARLEGILEASEETKTAMEETALSVSQYAYRSNGDPTRIDSDFQSRVRDIVQGSGLEVVNTQQLPAKAGSGYDEISLSFSASGDLSQLEEALTMLRAEEPRIRIEQLRLQPIIRALNNQHLDQRLSIQMVLVTIRLREG